MSKKMLDLLHLYTEKIIAIYGNHVQSIILYGSYARGDFKDDSDIDIMILLDITDIDIKKYRHQLSTTTYDFNMDYDIEIMPIAKNEEHFKKWVNNYPFYNNISQEGVVLYDAA